MADPPLADLFQAPRLDPAIDRETLVRGGWLMVRRSLRLVASLLVVGVGAWAVFHLDTPAKLGAVLAGTTLVWLPATVVQWRVAFRPSPPEPWLAARDPTALSDGDLRALMRSEVGEWLLTSMPAIGLAAWFVTGMHALTAPMKVGAIVVLVAMYVARQSRVVLKELIYEAQLDLDAFQPIRTARLLEALARVPGIALRDSLLHLVARTRFREGDAKGAIAAIDRIGSRRGWRVDLLRALFGLAELGPEEALRIADQADDDPDLEPIVDTIRALAHLAADRDDLVLADAERLLRQPAPEARWFATILVSAAEAATQPDRARERLATLPWPLDRVIDQVAGWPAVHRRLFTLAAPR